LKRYLPLLVILGLVTACADIATQSRTQVTGTATYKERMALPPNAVLEATLEDVTKAGALAEILGRTRIEQPGNPPFRFEITYDPSRIDPRHRYTVRARIMADGRLLFSTDRHYSVLTAGSGNEVALVLRRIGGSSEGSNEPLENTHWKLVRLGDTVVNVAEQQREPHLIFHPASRRVGGSGGCNRLTGSYERTDDRVAFGQMAGTLMTCPTGMDVEQKFLAALGQTTGVRITGKHLELLDAAGQVVADLEAVYVR
jgi:putative lipoprotein